MIDRSDYGIATVAAVYGWGTSHMLSVWLALPLWAQSMLQTVFTLVLGLGALTIQHFWRRWLNRNWPDGKSQTPAAPQVEEAGLARFDWFKLLRPVARPLFDLIRNAIARLRRRKES